MTAPSAVGGPGWFWGSYVYVGLPVGFRVHGRLGLCWTTPSPGPWGQPRLVSAPGCQDQVLLDARNFHSCGRRGSFLCCLCPHFPLIDEAGPVDRHLGHWHFLSCPAASGLLLGHYSHRFASCCLTLGALPCSFHTMDLPPHRVLGEGCGVLAKGPLRSLSLGVASMAPPGPEVCNCTLCPGTC